MLKHWFRFPFLQAVLAHTLAGYVRLVNATTRWEVHGLEIVEPIWQSRTGVIGAVWHGRVLLSIAGWPLDKQPPAFLISNSPDGAFIAKATLKLGAQVIRGSGKNLKKTKEKGGGIAFRQMVKHIANGGCMAITPDGPRGPAMQASMGAVRLAKRTGAPILCLSWSTKRRKVFGTWDRFLLPLPFTRGVIVWQGPIMVPPDAGAAILEEKRAALETLLRQGTQQADLACGHVPLEVSP